MAIGPCRVHVGASFQQRIDRVGVASGGSEHEHGCAIGRLPVHVGARLQQRIDRFGAR